MSLDPPTYIVSLQNNIRARPISWEGAVRAQTISDSDLKKIKAIDKVRKDQREQILKADAESYVVLFLGGAKSPSIFEQAAKRQDIVQYMLVQLDDVIEDAPSFVSALIKHPEAYSPFLPLLKTSASPDDPVPLLTSAVLSKILSQAVVSSPKSNNNTGDALRKLYAYLATLSQSSNAGHQDIAVQSYSSVLRTAESRQLFWELRDETLDPLMDILESAAGGGKETGSTLWSDGAASTRTALETGISGGVGIQLLYHVLLVLWQLSFEGQIVGDGLQEDHDILILYVQLLRISPKEKISRLLISSLYNLISTNRSSLLPAAGLARLPALLKTIQSRHLTDVDLVEDLNNLIDMLDEYTKTQTTFDEYAAEVRSGHLRWSPPHRNPTFWAENARRILDEGQAELPRALAAIMAKSWETDKQVLAIGCNDVACLVREVPEKRSMMEKLGLKTRVMELMQEPDEHVRWESLRALGEWLRYSFDAK